VRSLLPDLLINESVEKFLKSVTILFYQVTTKLAGLTFLDDSTTTGGEDAFCCIFSRCFFSTPRPHDPTSLVGYAVLQRRLADGNEASSRRGPHNGSLNQEFSLS